MQQNTNKIFWVIILNLSIVATEIFYGILGNSFALLSDALHNAGDVLALFVTYFALRLSLKKATFKYTFGFVRAEMMAAFVNSLFLFVVMFYIIYQSVNRLIYPEITNPIYMIIVGLIAFVTNTISAIILAKINTPSTYTNTHHHSANQTHSDNNIKSAYLHMLSDAMISLGVIIGGFFIFYLQIYTIDSWLAIVFSLYILWHTYPLLKTSFLSLMDANIVDDISPKMIKNIIKNNQNVIEYHDLHIHKPNSTHNFISFHLVFDDKNLSLETSNKIIKKIRKDLNNIGFNHVLIQSDLSNTDYQSS